MEAANEVSDAVLCCVQEQPAKQETHIMIISTEYQVNMLIFSHNTRNFRHTTNEFGRSCSEVRYAQMTVKLLLHESVSARHKKFTDFLSYTLLHISGL
jgi:hypothetical protein